MAGNIGSLVDILLFYTLERLLFNRMVGSMGKNAQMVKKAMTLWLMLEEIGYYDLIRTIHSFENTVIESLFDEALQCIECIQPSAIEPAESYDSPVFIGLFEDPINRRFFYYNREFMYKRYVHIMETVCEKIFGETTAIEVDESGLRPMIRPQGGESILHLGDREGTIAHGALLGTSNEAGEALGHASHEVVKQTHLNPDASEFHPRQTPEETRTMFLTFSSGHPLSRQEIFNFFTSNWGAVVQDVVIEQTRPGQVPLFGRVVFTTSLVIPLVLNGQVKKKYIVNRKHLWARVYIPRHLRR